MSEKAKAMAEKLASLPEELQDQFADKVDGATMALDYVERKAAEARKDGESSG